ncbi:MAG: PorV/PorQ family protein [Candidatus Marinimicrobia bacterium]|nr:PorV/PorQ family protein [Candidatus Neomarinimicrobiota bacterium]
MKFRKISFMIIIILLTLSSSLQSQEPYRVGTTTANFLEIGIGSDGIAMGDAYASIPGGLASIYWNPAGLAFMERNHALFMQQPWLVGINLNAAAASYVNPYIGTLSVGFYNMDYGKMDVTTLDMQEGTGEKFSADDYCFSFSYSRKLAQWFAFGATGKYITSQIWHETASAIAIDLGVLVNTNFFAFSGQEEDALKIGMSISNYGTKMKYSGMDLVYPIDIAPNENGNYEDTPGEYKLSEWELPLIFRFGMSFNPISTRYHRLTVAADALHPNNNSEYVNIGSQYRLQIPGTGSFFLRSGYKGVFMTESEYGLTYGGGLALNLIGNYVVKVDYAFRDLGILGNTNTYTIELQF